MEWYEYLIAVGGGALAGSINTLAGSGSAITLTILTEVLGLPGNLANGTNRIGVLTQSAAGSWAFHRYGKLNFSRSKVNLVMTTVGALIGVWMAISVSNEQFMVVFKYLMVAVFMILLIKPKRWLRETSEDKAASIYLAVPLYLALGFYGGFIQMGMGVFYLATVVLVDRYSIIEGNALKSFVVFLYTIAILTIFAIRGLVAWEVGAVLAVGQTAGGYYTAKFASRYPKANLVAYWLLVIIVIAALLQLFGLVRF